MKSFLPYGFRAICVALLSFFAISAPTARAGVNEFNTDPSYLLHLTILTTHYAGYGNSWSEYYSETLAFGESLFLEDFLYSGGEGPEDYWGVTYELTYFEWEFIGPPGGGSGGSPGGGGGGGGTGSGEVAGLSVEFFNENPSNLPVSLDGETTHLFHYFNRAGSHLTFRPINQSEQVLGGDVQWRVTDSVSDTLVQDWVASTAIYLWDLNERSYLVEARSIGGSRTYSALFGFTQASLSPTPENGYRIRQPGASYPHKQERWSSCGIGTFRNLLHIFGKPVPSEDQIIQELLNVGVPDWKWWVPPDADNAGMAPTAVVGYANVVLSPRGVTLTQNQNMTQEQFEASLNSGAVHFVGIQLVDWDKNPRNGAQPAGHAVVMRKSGNKIEMIDPATGKSTKHTFQEVIGMIIWGGNPKATSDIFTATAS